MPQTNMKMQENISLKPYNSFGIDARARFFTRFGDVDSLQQLLEQFAADQKNLLILGGGSNMLLTKDYDGLVLKNEIEGIRVVEEDDRHIYVRAGAGFNWHRFVRYCVEHTYAGLENLSLIPGNVGASPMQNIGAYGVEVKDVFHTLEALHLRERSMHTFSLNDCRFGYRESVFKREYKDQFVITAVTFRLNKQPVFRTDYGAIRQELEAMGVKELSIEAISQAVIRIRSSKLPDPKEIGNAGSFFKNPVVPNAQFGQLKNMHPGVIAFPAGEGYTKLAAGWLIEQCGWKGYRKGDAGCYAKQALVLVNYGSATGQEVYDLSASIISSVQEKFGITLEREVNII